MKNEFLIKIHAGKFKEAHMVIANLDHKKRNQFLLELAIDTQSIATYAFVGYLLTVQESPELHYCAAGLLNHAFCYLTGAYSTALFHARRAANLLPHDISCKEELLYYFGLPDQVMDSEEAQKIAKGILVQDATNKIAHNVIQKIKNYNEF